MELILLEIAAWSTIGLAAAALVMAWRSPSVSRALTAMLTLYFVLWYFLPVGLSIALWDKLTTHFASENEFLRISAIEAGSFAAIVFCFPFWQTPSKIIKRCTLYSFRATSSIILGAAVLSVLLSAYLHFSSDFGGSYLERNAFAVTGAGTDAYNRSGSIIFVAEFCLVLVYAALVSPKQPRIHKWVSPFLLSVVGFWIYTQVSEGSRIPMLMPLILFILYAAFNALSLRRVATIMLIAGPGLGVAMGLVTIAVQFTRSQESDAFGSSGEIVGSVVGSPDAVSQVGSLMGSALVFKLDSFSTGALLLDAYGIADGGMKPYVGSALAAVPRIFYENKPVPGSRDGTYAGDPGRLVAVSMGMDPNSGNAGIGMASIVLWQLGYLGLPLLLAANVINLRILNSLLLSESVLARAVALLAIGPPSLAGLLATPDVILMNLQRLILMIAVISFAVWVIDRRAWIAGTERTHFLEATPS